MNKTFMTLMGLLDYQNIIGKSKPRNTNATINDYDVRASVVSRVERGSQLSSITHLHEEITTRETFIRKNEKK